MMFLTIDILETELRLFQHPVLDFLVDKQLYVTSQGNICNIQSSTINSVGGGLECRVLGISRVCLHKDTRKFILRLLMIPSNFHLPTMKHVVQRAFMYLSDFQM